MLVSLSIRDVVLIDKLDLEFSDGLVVLTGETGAGKSILLDSLGLALGERGDSTLVRPGADKLSVTAEFALSKDHSIQPGLAEHAIDFNDGIIVLRRTVGQDGRSRAFINDQATSIGLLRKIGSSLVEMHSQFDTHGLMDIQTHLDALDRFRKIIYGTKCDIACGETWSTWQRAQKKWREAGHFIQKAKAEEEDLRAHIEALETLAPVSGEEDELSSKRSLLRHSEQILSAIELARRALKEPADIDAGIHAAQRELGLVAEKAGGQLDAVYSALDRVAVELVEVESALAKAASDFVLDPLELEATEERLFGLKAEARKHAVNVDDLAETLASMHARLEAIEGGEEHLIKLAKLEQTARHDFLAAARLMTEERRRASKILADAVIGELGPLRLLDASFEVVINPLSEEDWSKEGCDSVVFHVTTNPGIPLGPLNKIASGGELARFLLALKVVLADSQRPAAMVFDEVDSGIGGATASAVGERLEALANTMQVLVVTHSPQVAARGMSHWHVSKVRKGEYTVTRVLALGYDERREEIARMLSGPDVTDEARAAASILMAGT